jgi:hypothetical protein
MNCFKNLLQIVHDEFVEALWKELISLAHKYTGLLGGTAPLCTLSNSLLSTISCLCHVQIPLDVERMDR